MNEEETSHGAPNLRALPSECARKVRVAVCNEHALKNKVHRLIAFAAEKWLIDADVGAKEKGPYCVRSRRARDTNSFSTKPHCLVDPSIARFAWEGMAAVSRSCTGMSSCTTTAPEFLPRCTNRGVAQYGSENVCSVSTARASDRADRGTRSCSSCRLSLLPQAGLESDTCRREI